VMQVGELEVQPLAVLGAPPQPRVPIRFEKVPLHELKVGRKGAVYLIKLDVSELTKEKAAKALEELKKGLEERFGIRLLYGATTKNEVWLVIRGSPFSWLALLAWLPFILGLLGIVLFGVSVWQAIASIPPWVWATLIIGGALLIFGPAIGEWVLELAERPRRKVHIWEVR